MVIYFKGVSFEDEMMGRVDYYAEVENENGEVDVEEIKAAIEEVKEYVDSVLEDEDSEEYDEVEMWDAYDYINEAMDRLGYSCEIIDNDLESETFAHIKSDSVEDVDIKADVTIEI